MLFEGCQGNKGVQIREKVCPNCGRAVELMSTDVYTQCEECGFTVYSDLVDCVGSCSRARECLGESYYLRLMEARKQWEEQMKQLQNDDEW